MMKTRLVLSLILTALLCGCCTTVPSTQSQETVLPQTPQPLAPLRPGHNWIARWL